MPSTILRRGLEIPLCVLVEREVPAGIAQQNLSGPNQKLVATKEALMVERKEVCGLFQRAKHGVEVPEGD